jgi:hypothetical protein
VVGLDQADGAGRPDHGQNETREPSARTQIGELRRWFGARGGEPEGVAHVIGDGRVAQETERLRVREVLAEDREDLGRRVNRLSQPRPRLAQ